MAGATLCHMPTLDWIGKKAVVNHHLRVPYRLLKDAPSLSCGDPGTGNLILQGDNLLALKALLPFYGGQVKCIYIDPPYNTGNEGWAYNDNVKSPTIQKWLGEVVGKEDETLDRHDRWLCMMYPRLSLLREFLSEDGYIFVSIGDDEVADARLLLDEIFGENNFLAQLVWQKGKKGDSKFFSICHEYMLVYAASKQSLIKANTRLRRNKPGLSDVFAQYAELQRQFGNDHIEIRKAMMAWYKSLPKGHPAKAHKHYNWSDDRGLYFPDNFHGPDDGRKSRPRYDIIHPITGKPCKLPSTGWRWEEETTKAALAEVPPRIHFGRDEKTIPCRKSYLAEVNDEAFPSVIYKDGRAATLEVESLVGKGKFDFPKDSDVLSEIIGMVCQPGDIVLDSFAGSGTTGHAVLKLNATRPEDQPRRFILVEMEPEIAKNITAERVRRAAEGYKNAKGKAIAGLGGGFRFCELGGELFDEFGQIHDAVTFGELARHVWFSEFHEPLPHARVPKSPFLGECNGTGLYLLYNGILGDKSKNGGNILTRAILERLPPYDGPKIIFCAGNLLGPDRLRSASITIRQTPYEIKVS